MAQSNFYWVQAAWLIVGMLALLRDEFLPEWATVHVYSILPFLSLQAWIIGVLLIVIVAVIEASYTQHEAVSEAQQKRIIFSGYAPDREPKRSLVRKYVMPIGSVIILAAVYQFWPTPVSVAISLPQLSKITPLPVKSVRDLYANDFRGLLRASSKHIVSLDDGTRWKVEERVFMDFPNQSMFVGFFLPSSPRAYKLCERITSSYSVAIGDVFSNVSMIVSHPVYLRNGVALANLKFSGHVYIYHEDEFSPDKKAVLLALFRRFNATAVFRGPLEVVGGNIESVPTPSP